MKRNIAVALSTAIGLLAMASTSHACRRPLWLVPQIDHLDRYSAVLAVEVTGIHLSAYEFHQLVRRGIRKPPQRADGIEYMYVTSATPDFEVNVLVDRPLRGKSKALRKFVLGGCSVEIAKLRERGIFFVDPDGKHATAVWASQTEEYLKWAQALGVDRVEP